MFGFGKRKEKENLKKELKDEVVLGGALDEQVDEVSEFIDSFDAEEFKFSGGFKFVATYSEGSWIVTSNVFGIAKYKTIKRAVDSQVRYVNQVAKNDANIRFPAFFLAGVKRKADDRIDFFVMSNKPNHNIILRSKVGCNFFCYSPEHGVEYFGSADFAKNRASKILSGYVQMGKDLKDMVSMEEAICQVFWGEVKGRMFSSKIVEGDLNVPGVNDMQVAMKALGDFLTGNTEE